MLDKSIPSYSSNAYYEQDPKSLESAMLLPRRRTIALVLSRLPSMFRLSMKRLSLALLVLQNSALIVTMHYSRVSPVIEGHRYFPSTAIFLVEVLKLAVSSTIALYELYSTNPSAPFHHQLKTLTHSVFSGDSWKLTIPAALWTLQSSIVYVAISNLDAATFQATYQIKILTAVLVSILLLGKSISARQWLALIFLTVGVAIVQMPESFLASTSIWMNIQSYLPASLNFTSPSTPALGLSTAKSSKTGMNSTIGFLATLAAAVISGITGVYFEKVLKDTAKSVTVWTRNVQLSFYSLFPALLIGVLWQDGAAISNKGFFVGYNWTVLVMISLQAFGGIIVAVCIAYTDNIEKNFAASVSIVFSCVVSAAFFDVPLTVNFSIGTAIVLLGVYLYHTKPLAAGSRSRNHELPLLATNERTQ